MTLRKASVALIVTFLFVVGMVFFGLVRSVHVRETVRVERDRIVELRESLRTATVLGQRIAGPTVTTTVTVTATTTVHRPSPGPTVTVTQTTVSTSTPTVTVTTTPPDECDILPPNACPRAQGVTAAAALLPVVLVGFGVLFHRATKGES